MTYRGNVLAEIESALDCGKNGITLNREQMQQVLEIYRGVVEAKNEATKDNHRLLCGDFTPEEFQNLCHNRHESPGCTRAEFEAGCREYQEKLFG